MRKEHATAKKRKVAAVIGSIMTCVGVFFILILVFGDSFYTSHQKQAMELFASDSHARFVDEEDSPSALKTAFQEYNDRLRKTGQIGISDPFSENESSFDIDFAQYGIDAASDPLAFIEIPSIDIVLPVFAGASENHLSGGAGLMSSTSYLLGEQGENAVIAAHRGYWQERMFKDIDKLAPGDEIIVHTFWSSLSYHVRDTKIIEPNDISAVLIDPNSTQITLLSCHPYMTWGKRIIVTADLS